MIMGRRKGPAELILVTLLRGQGALELFSARAGNFLSGLALGLLDDSALVRLTISSYDRRGTYNAQQIRDWEVDWFAADLPSPPARLLVGAAGSGREVAHLEEQGYEVFAFEPASRYVQNANQTSRLGRPMLEGSYDDLLDQSSLLQQRLSAERSFDGILLGWGSITHVPGQDRRIAMFKKLRLLCPRGPLLASFCLAQGRTQPGLSRARNAGLRVARLLGGSGDDPSMDGISGSHGYAHWFTDEELQELAAESGYRLKNQVLATAFPYPHATFLPAQDDSLEQGK